MQVFTFVVAAILAATGLIGFVVTGSTHFTALIPLGFGVGFAIVGIIGRNGGKPRMHAMHGALVLALLGVFGSLRGVVKLPTLLAGTAEKPVAVVAQVTMCIVCIAFLVGAVRSFVAARKARQAA
jgi:hypothetical protein